MVGGWAAAEMIRYSFYAISLFWKPTYLHYWLRYSAWAVLYPVGGGSEAYLVYLALPTMRHLARGIRMPNRWNFSFDFYSFLVFLTFAYAIGAPCHGYASLAYVMLSPQGCLT
jgi:very-long-chain (3R)-3-hydroxyacyl-CoA dehydratase